MARRQQHLGGDTAARILDLAEELVQQRGFNGFSYRDIAAELGITTATLHYHFPSKADLGRTLIERYAQRFVSALAAIESGASVAAARLEAYVELYAAVVRDHRLCLCGMLAAEYATLPEGMREAVLGFFDANERWLTEVLEHGRASGEIHFEGPATDEARMIVSGLEGAMLLARPYGDVGRFQAAANCLLASLASSQQPRPA